MVGSGYPASRVVRRTASATECCSAEGTRTITHPPKPPPVMRAPSAPAATALSAMRSMWSVVIGEVIAHRRLGGGEDSAHSGEIGIPQRGNDIEDPLIVGEDVAGAAGIDWVVHRSQGRRPGLLRLTQGGEPQIGGCAFAGLAAFGVFAAGVAVRGAGVDQ